MNPINPAAMIAGGFFVIVSEPEDAREFNPAYNRGDRGGFQYAARAGLVIFREESNDAA